MEEKKKKKLAPLVTLSNGEKIPIVGLGTFCSNDEEKLINVVLKAYEIGYRHFDTAEIYGNEPILGKAFKKLFDMGVKREELFITSKLFPWLDKPVVPTLKNSLKVMNLDYVDLYLLHWPCCPPKLEGG